MHFKRQVDISLTSKSESMSQNRKQTSKSTSDLRLNQHRYGLGVAMGIRPPQMLWQNKVIFSLSAHL